MIKTVVKALEGFERQFEEVCEMKARLDEEKEYAKALAIQKVEADFADRARKIDSVLEVMSVTEEIEVPDEPVVEEIVAENIEENPEFEACKAEESC